MYTGGFSVVYPIQLRSQKCAFRCWHKNIDDLKYHYKEIDEYLKKINLPYFVDFHFVEKGITVNGDIYPTTRMDWVEGDTLKKYLEKQLTSPIKIEKLAADFLEMVKQLHANKIAHGDLQHGNILVNAKEQIFLVDYDSLCVPALIGKNDEIKGLPDYQHPSRFKSRILNYNLDYFSELVIYTSLLALAEVPSLWAKYNLGDLDNSLLFSKDDFTDAYHSEFFREIQKTSDRLRYYCGVLKEYCLSTDLDSFVPLEEVVDEFGIRLIEQPSIKSFSTDKSQYRQNNPVLLSWEVENADKIEINAGRVIDVSNQSSFTIPMLAGDLRVTLKAFNLFGEDQAFEMVGIKKSPSVIVPPKNRFRSAYAFAAIMAVIIIAVFFYVSKEWIKSEPSSVKPPPLEQPIGDVPVTPKDQQGFQKILEKYTAGYSEFDKKQMLSMFDDKHTIVNVFSSSGNLVPSYSGESLENYLNRLRLTEIKNIEVIKISQNNGISYIDIKEH